MIAAKMLFIKFFGGAKKKFWGKSPSPPWLRAWPLA